MTYVLLIYKIFKRGFLHDSKRADRLKLVEVGVRVRLRLIKVGVKVGVKVGYYLELQFEYWKSC